jgi:hypothetical protein
MKSVGILIALVASLLPIVATTAGNQPAAPTGSSVNLVNEGAQTLNFALRPAGGKWTVYSVGAGRSTTLGCDDCTIPYFEFSITTAGQRVDYRLMPAQTYLFEWNREKQRWDLSHPE